MTELWKDVQGYEGLYQVSNMGNVRSVDHEVEVTRNGITFVVPKKGKVLSPTRRQHGYVGVMLYGKGGHATRGFKTFAVHRLVAEAFVENPNGYDEVNHLDECKTNNRADNLEWCDRSYNVRYGTGIERGHEKIGELLRKPVVQMDMQGNVIREWESLTAVERETGMSKSSICNCCKKHRKYSHAYGYRWEYADKR